MLRPGALQSGRRLGAAAPVSRTRVKSKREAASGQRDRQGPKDTLRAAGTRWGRGLWGSHPAASELQLPELEPGNHHPPPKPVGSGRHVAQPQPQPQQRDLSRPHFFQVCPPPVASAAASGTSMSGEQGADHSLARRLPPPCRAHQGLTSIPSLSRYHPRKHLPLAAEEETEAQRRRARRPGSQPVESLGAGARPAWPEEPGPHPTPPALKTQRRAGRAAGLPAAAPPPGGLDRSGLSVSCAGVCWCGPCTPGAVVSRVGRREVKGQQ